ncbi:MAG: hypothetical protein CMH57_05470 [Myxococcales bacterium]|nr:hypothetical protein [Myxococcales bacterium]
MFCNDDPSRGSVVLCENDLCLDDICAALCAASGAAPNANYCRDGNLSCQAEGASWLEAERLGGASVSAGLCAPRRCAGPESCDEAGGERVYCALERVRLGEEGGLRGGCRRDNPRQDGSLALGEACGGFGEPPELERCASRTCVGFPPNYFCTGLCDSDADCGEEQRCRVDRLEVSGEVLFVNLCGYARGSQTPCADNRGCDGGEVCAPFTFGQVGPSGKTLRGGRREGLCIVPVPSGVPTGSACEEQGCLAPGTCLPSGAGGVRLCADVCDPGDFTACELGLFCEEFVVVTDEEHEDGGALTQGWCVGF